MSIFISVSALFLTSSCSFRYPIPVLQLTEEGKSAREQKRDFDLKFHAVIIKPTSNNTIEETFFLFQQTKNIAQVAQQRQLAQSTIWGHLIFCIAMGKMKAEELVSAEKIFDAPLKIDL